MQQATQLPGQAAAQRASAGPAAGRGDFFERLQHLRQQFDDNGYVVIPNVVSRDKLEQLRGKILDEYDRSLRAGTLLSGGGRISGHLNCFPGEEARFAYAALEDHGIINLVRTLFPKSVRAPNVGCNFNLPNSVAQHYHVDRNFTDPFVIVNVAVADTTIENGAIDVVPKTHAKFYKFWRFALERPYRAAKQLPLQQGDVLVRTSNLWHRGMPNKTAVPRPMLAFTWEDGGSLLDDPFAWEGGKIIFRENWYRPNLLGRLRERTFVAAPVTYSAYRFVRSLFGTKGYDRP